MRSLLLISLLLSATPDTERIEVDLDQEDPPAGAAPAAVPPAPPTEQARTPALAGLPLAVAALLVRNARRRTGEGS